MKTISVDGLQCAVAGSDRGRVVYLLSPLDGDDALQENIAAKYGITLVTVTGMDWDNDLTPWPASGVPRGCPPFKGNAGTFLQHLTDSVIPVVENTAGINADAERTLAGVSLSGLFALWQWIGGDLFRNIISISGSFWYDGFVKWLDNTTIPRKEGKAYLSLGVEEPNSSNRIFATVGDCTRRVADRLAVSGADVRFEWNPGNHYAAIGPRMARALDFICG